MSVVVLVLGLLLAACSAGSRFDDASVTNPTGKTPPPVLLKQLVGLPPDKAKIFKDALAIAGGQHDIGIVEGQLQSGAFTLSGNFRAEVQAGTAQVTYSLELRDDLGVLADTISGTLPAGAAAGNDAWAAVSPAVLATIAQSAAREMAAKLMQMGYATRMASLIVPPPEYWMVASAGAQFDIDLETLNGPSAIEPVASPESLAEQDLASAAPAAEPKVPPPPSDAAVRSGPVAIQVVAVVPVEGASASGNRELTDAMRQAMKAAGWPVVAAARADALVVKGIVRVADAEGGSQRVALRWLVTTPRGGRLGDVNQANLVPAGSLDSAWGAVAAAAAEAAAGGIFEIVKKYR